MANTPGKNFAPWSPRFRTVASNIENTPIKVFSKTGKMGRNVPLETRIALPEDLEAHAEELLRVHQDPDKVKGRLTRGDVAVLGLVEGRLAHVQWLALASPVDIEEAG